MRKQTKLVAVLSAAALLAIGASMTSFAATGWVEDNGDWYFYDNDGNAVENEWRKSSGYWFYLGEDGVMVTNTLIEDSDNNDNYFYVGEDGAMVTNRWVELENEDYDGDDEDATTVWYYFQANGKAYKAGSNGKTSFKTINGKKYAFDDDGKMLYGWIDDNSTRITGDDAWRDGVYYCGDSSDGAMAVGWAQIHCIDDTEDDEDQDYWFYFKTNGKKVENTSNTKTLTYKTINGRKYGFNEYGVMQDEWSYFNSTASSLASAYNYFNSPEDGHRTQRGWIYAVPSEDFDADKYNDDEACWYYADGQGDLAVAQFKTINGKKYAFDTKARMLNSLQAIWTDANGKITKNLKIDEEARLDALKGKDGNFIYTNDSGTAYNMADANMKVYYFGASDDGAIKTGTVNVTVDGETNSFMFKKSGNTKGQGLSKIEDNKYIVVNGFKLKADSDMKYEAFTTANAQSYTYGENGANVLGKYLVNTSGSLMKSKRRAKDADEYYYTTNSNGIVIKVEEKNDNNDYVTLCEQ